MHKRPDLFPATAWLFRSPAGGRRWGFYLLGVAVVAAIAWSAWGREAVAYGSVPAPASSTPVLDRLIARAERAERLWRGVESFYEQEVAPIERVLLSYRDDRALAQRIALALISQANAVGLEPRLLLAVLLVENPWLDPEIRSSVGAIGLMQVMPQHRGNWPPCEPDLEDVEANICHGTRIFAHYYQEMDGDIERALLRYNGCVRGTNTPNCHTYPYHVYARAGRASILAWLRPPVSDPSDP
ncbi:MAG TPA: lytic transglycosylase domain-containing protein [Longimicrobiales bacterium]